MDKEQLRQEANKARTIAVVLAENIYKYLGNVISKEELKNVVDSLMSTDFITRFNHIYIQKDTYKNTFINGFLDELADVKFAADDTDTLVIKDKKYSKGE